MNRRPKKKPSPARKRPAPARPRKSKGRPPRKVAPRPGALEPVPPVVAENPQALLFARRVAGLLAEKKATDVVILDVRGKSSYTDYVVVASGDSERQVAAMAEHVSMTLKQEGRYTLGSEGQQLGQWVLLDYAQVILHLFLADVRMFYDLEGLWADAAKERVA